MTYVDVVDRMQAIQTRLAQLAPPARGSSASATSFASALDGATASTAVGSAAATGGTAPVGGSALAADGVTGDDVVRDALQYEGVPYVLGGESKAGMDCSGLVQRTFSDLGVDVPRLVHEQQTIGQEVGSLKDARPGDLIVLNGGDHVAIWMGNDTVLHAPYPGRNVSVQKAWFTDRDVTAIRRVVPSGDVATTGSTSTTAGALSPSTFAQATAMAGTGDGSPSSPASLLGSSGLSTGGSSSTQQQLLAARSVLVGAGV